MSSYLCVPDVSLIWLDLSIFAYKVMKAWEHAHNSTQYMQWSPTFNKDLEQKNSGHAAIFLETLTVIHIKELVWLGYKANS